ncbi:hypothetical protein [Limnobaculum parvum]|nr:hypothetical protein [Limnobaculum parvum]
MYELHIKVESSARAETIFTLIPSEKKRQNQADALCSTMTR